MTQKLLIKNKPVSVLLQTIDPEGIADESVRRTVEILLNLVEELNSQVKELREENQRLRSENNPLKGELGQPDIKAKNNKGSDGNHSSEKERQTPKKHSKSSKNQSIKIDREEIIEYPHELLPADAQFKGYEEVIV
jgi:regulator of replication initiation timing